ncbi:sensor histidine kinase [Streptomyces sp. NBC_00872]|uniref:sensor histidine kinase n=1 Tax=Streptomyces sp. NBC_00872 TaxID=2903686 RepID=UPI00386AB81B|nr:histidine kinase [Streptomyces sp. NBC_00872]
MRIDRPPPRPRAVTRFSHLLPTVAECCRRLAVWWRTRPSATRDLEFAVVLAVLSFAAPLDSVGAQFGDLPVRQAGAPSVLLTLGQILPLALRTRAPAGCLALVGLCFTAHQACAYPPNFGSLGLYAALYSVGAYQDRWRLLLPVPAFAAYVVFALVLWRLGSPAGFVDYAVYFLALAVFWGVGAFVRGRRADEAERRRLAAQAATAEERARLARELHDVVTHHVTAMVVQADAAQFLSASPDSSDRLTEGLTAISGTGRRALAELRYLLGVLEATGESAPSERVPAHGRLSDLVEQTRLAGQPVEFVEDGARAPMDIGTELAVYRVVQESLTNAVKYAAGRPTLVRVHYGHHHMDVAITTEGPCGGATGVAPRPVGGHVPGGGHVAGGRGLGGLRERVDMLGGRFTAESRPDGGFAVGARIPTGGAV